MRTQRHAARRFDLRRWRTAGLILSLVVIAALAVPLAHAAPRAQTEPVLRVGYLGVADSDTANGAQLAMDQINAAGGFTGPDGTTYQFELVTLTAAPPTAESLPNDIAELTRRNVVAILGPDDNALLTTENVQALLDTRLPVLTGATSDTLTDTDLDNFLFRIRAPEHVYSYALATYLLEDLDFTQIALVQTDIESTEALIAFDSALSAAGVSAIDRIQVTSGADIPGQVEGLVSLNPEAIVMWGPAEDANLLLRQLRDAGWTGRFAYRFAEEAAATDALPDTLANGTLGVTSWSFGYTSRASRIFLREYVTTFGRVPGALSAAGYDAIWFLRAVVTEAGADPEAIRTGLLSSSPRTLVQGTLHPVDYANGDLARLAFVYELGARGGPTVVARFDDTQRLPLEDAPEVVQAVPTPTPALPVATSFPSATFEGTVVTVTANVLNVRTGPGFNYDKVGQVQKGDVLRVISAIADYSWLAVDFRGTVGWIKTEYTEPSGDLTSVSIVQAPPSPTIGATATASLPPNPDLVIDTVILSPAQPIPNRPFTATVTVRNAGGGAAGQFAIAATFQPGNVYLASIVGGLAGGQTAQVQLNGTLTGSGVQQVAVIADLNREVAEFNEDNNVYNITYRADYPTFVQQSGVVLTANTPWDLYGGTQDFSWDGYNIAMQNGAMIGQLGDTFENATYDTVTPSVVNNTVGVGTDKVNPGAVFGIITAEGKRAVMRIDNRQDTTIWISYRVYNDTP